MTCSRVFRGWVWLLLVVVAASVASAAEPALRAGAFAKDITPTQFPVIVNGSFLENTAAKAFDPLHARAIVLDDGAKRLAICVVDSCMVPRPVLDEAKQLAAARTKIPVERMLISATHTHAAPSTMAFCLGSRRDEAYTKRLPGMIAEAIAAAEARLQPAHVGWRVIPAPDHTHCRRWITRPDRIGVDPFGGKTVHAMMHPGYQNPDYIGPAGPVDANLSILSFQSPSGEPIAVLANYSMHYFGSPRVSADYFGRFAAGLGERIGAGDEFVAIMSQGTSGDQHWMDYGGPQRKLTIDEYTDGLLNLAAKAYERIEYRDAAPLAMAQSTLKLRRRTPDAARLTWAKDIIAKMEGPVARSRTEVYAQQAIQIDANPESELILQAVRIGGLGITAMPNEVFGLTGLKLKARSPLATTFNIELANGAEGYIPPPEQHALGGYTTWPALTAGLEIEAEPKIVETVLRLLEEVAGKPRRAGSVAQGDYARAVLASKPRAYWRMHEMDWPAAWDSAGDRAHGAYEPGVAMYLDGPDAAGFSDGSEVNRAVHFAGGRLKLDAPNLGDTYTAEMWFWNGLPHDARAVTGYLFSLGRDGDKSADGDHLGIGGMHTGEGRLIFYNGNTAKNVVAGRTPLKAKHWHHVALVRDGKRVTVYLDGNTEPEFSTEIEDTRPDGASLFIGGRCDSLFNFAGKVDEVAVYDRVLTAGEIARHNRASGAGPLKEIVFGSCLDMTDHPMLDRTLALPMDLFIFMGDNIYADTQDMAVMEAKYDALKTSRFFRGVRSRVPVLATWDDHDFGGNDAGASFPMRRESQREFLDWLDVPEDSPRRQREGIYGAHLFGPPDQRVQVILLDTRYFRSPLARVPKERALLGGPYVPSDDPNATMLGEAQWQWFEAQLRQPAKLRLIISSIQFVGEFGGSEAWANLPLEKKRLLDLIAETRAGGVIFLSGDRHWCELSRMDGPLGYPLYDLTASAMTQVHKRGTPTINRFRFLEKTYHQPNVGRLRIDWGAADPLLKLEILDVEGTVQIEHVIKLSELQPR